MERPPDGRAGGKAKGPACSDKSNRACTLFRAREIMDRPKYSQSELKTFLKCGKMWEFRYLKGIKTPPSGALTVGSSVDSAVSANLAQKIITGTDLSTEEVLDEYSSDFEQRKPDTDWRDDDPGAQKDSGAELVGLHHREAAPHINPETVQESFVLETDAGYDLEGTIDLTEKDGTVVDTKTSRALYPDGSLSRNFQASLYDFAFETTRRKPARGFRFDVLVKSTSRRAPQLQRVEGRVDTGDREWLFESVSQVHRAIQAGVALPAPEGSWYCSEKWCGYWSQCKGRKKL